MDSGNRGDWAQMQCGAYFIYFANIHVGSVLINELSYLFRVGVGVVQQH